MNAHFFNFLHFAQKPGILPNRVQHQTLVSLDHESSKCNVGLEPCLWVFLYLHSPNPPLSQPVIPSLQSCHYAHVEKKWSEKRTVPPGEAALSFPAEPLPGFPCMEEKGFLLSRTGGTDHTYKAAVHAVYHNTAPRLRLTTAFTKRQAYAKEKRASSGHPPLLAILDPRPSVLTAIW